MRRTIMRGSLCDAGAMAASLDGGRGIAYGVSCGAARVLVERRFFGVGLVGQGGFFLHFVARVAVAAAAAAAALPRRRQIFGCGRLGVRLAFLLQLRSAEVCSECLRARRCALVRPARSAFGPNIRLPTMDRPTTAAQMAIDDLAIHGRHQGRLLSGPKARRNALTVPQLAAAGWCRFGTGVRDGRTT